MTPNGARPGPGRGPRRAKRGGHRARCRWPVGPGRWEVRARVERFVEPTLLLALRDGPAYGYDLADQLEDLAGDERIDLGNLYRLLRGLEEEGIVTSEWRNDQPGRSKRTYELTDVGRGLLDEWAQALTRAQDTIAGFRRRYDERNHP